MEDWVYEYVGFEADDEGVDYDELDLGPIEIAWTNFSDAAQDALMNLLGEDGAELYMENDGDLYLLFMTVSESGRSFLDGDMDHIEADLPISLEALDKGLKSQLIAHVDYTGGGTLNEAISDSIYEAAPDDDEEDE